MPLRMRTLLDCTRTHSATHTNARRAELCACGHSRCHCSCHVTVSVSSVYGVPFAAQPSSRSEILFVTGRHVRYVHIPDDLNIVEAIDAKALCCLLTRCLHCSDSDLRTRHTRTNRWHHVLASSREHDYGNCDCGTHNNHPTKRAGGSHRLWC